MHFDLLMKTLTLGAIKFAPQPLMPKRCHAGRLMTSTLGFKCALHCCNVICNHRILSCACYCLHVACASVLTGVWVWIPQVHTAYDAAPGHLIFELTPKHDSVFFAYYPHYTVSTLIFCFMLLFSNVQCALIPTVRIMSSNVSDISRSTNGQASSGNQAASYSCTMG